MTVPSSCSCFFDFEICLGDLRIRLYLYFNSLMSSRRSVGFFTHSKGADARGVVVVVVVVSVGAAADDGHSFCFR